MLLSKSLMILFVQFCFYFPELMDAVRWNMSVVYYWRRCSTSKTSEAGLTSNSVSLGGAKIVWLIIVPIRLMPVKSFSTAWAYFMLVACSTSCCCLTGYILTFLLSGSVSSIVVIWSKISTRRCGRCVRLCTRVLLLGVWWWLSKYRISTTTSTRTRSRLVTDVVKQALFSHMSQFTTIMFYLGMKLNKA